MSMQDKVVLITGAANGIGERIARSFAERGARLMLADINAAAGKLLSEELGAQTSCEFVKTDVSDSGAVDQLVQSTLASFGQLDCAVNNAGVAHDPCPLFECDDATLKRMLDINLCGVFYCMRAELRVMLGAGGGTIVNTASIAGLGGAPSLAPYAASKHGVVGLTRTAAVEYGKRGVRVNAVCPSYTRTAMLDHILEKEPDMEAMLAKASPMKRFGETREVADTVLWLSSPDSSFVNGQCIAVDGGITAW